MSRWRPAFEVLFAYPSDSSKFCSNINFLKVVIVIFRVTQRRILKSVVKHHLPDTALLWNSWTQSIVVTHIRHQQDQNSCMYPGTCISVQAYMWRAEVDIRFLIQLFLTIQWDDLSLNLEFIKLTRPAIQQTPPACLPSRMITEAHSHTCCW